MKRNLKNQIVSLLILGVLLGSFAGCGTNQKELENSSETSGKQENTEVTVVKAVAPNAYYPFSYLNDDGELEGYNIDVMKLVDEALPQYTWEVEASSGDALLIGLEQGIYDEALGGFLYTEEREEKYIFPEFIGGNVQGIITTKDHSDVTNLTIAIEQNLKLAPTLARGGILGTFEDYNASHPDKPLEYDLIDSREAYDIWTDVLNGRYDYDVENLASYEKIVSNEPDGDIATKLVFNGFQAVKFYELFNKDQQELADAYSEVIRQLKEDGTLKELYEKWFGQDCFKYFDENSDSEYGKLDE